MNNEENAKENNFSFAKIKMLAIFLCFLIPAIYLGIINTSAVKGYEIKKVEQEIEELKKENKKLQIQEAELNSFYNIKDNIGNLNMVEVKDVVYIDDNEGTVAIGNK